MFYLLIWRCFKAKSSFLRADGSGKRFTRKSRSLILLFIKKKNKTKQAKKKTDDQIRLLGKAFEQNFTTNQSSKVQMPQGLLEGKLKRRID